MMVASLHEMRRAVRCQWCDMRKVRFDAWLRGSGWLSRWLSGLGEPNR